jgi:putative ABC transport system substrate-binding protein
VAFELRWADGQFDRLPGLAADLAGRKVAVIAAFGNASSLNRPGGNVTGVSILNQELESTRLERLVEVVPDATIIAFLVNPESLTADPKLREMENTAHMFNRHLQVLNARNESEFEQVFVTVEQQRIGAMVVTSDTMFSNESATLGRVSARHTGAYDGSLSRFHERRRVDELRQRLGRCLSSRGSLRGANSQRRSAARSAGYAIHPSRVCHQYENR